MIAKKNYIFEKNLLLHLLAKLKERYLFEMYRLSCEQIVPILEQTA